MRLRLIMFEGAQIGGFASEAIVDGREDDAGVDGFGICFDA